LRRVKVQEKGAQGRFKLAKANKIESALGSVRRLGYPKHIDGEAVLEGGQAAWDGGSVFKSSWKMGQLFLTKDKLAFYQGQNQIKEIQVSAITGTEVLERNWVPGRKTTQLCVFFERGEIRRKAFYSFDDAGLWRDLIENLIAEER